MHSIKKAFLLALIATPSLQAVIIESNSIEIMTDWHDQELGSTYIVLDIDHTIGKCVLKRTFKPWFSHVFNLNSSNSFLDRIQHVLKLKPMEVCTVPLIQNFQKQNVPVLVLTARTKKVTLSTLQHLNELDLNFSTAFADVPDQHIHVPSFKPAWFEQGIIYCARQDKGLVLTEFFKKNNLAPKRIIFADDLLKNVQSVHTAMNDAGIECIAIHYTRKKLYGRFDHVTDALKSLFNC